MSNKIDLNFIPVAYFSITRWSWLGIGILFLGMMFSLTTYQLYQKKQVNVSAVVLKLAQLDHQSTQIKRPVRTANVEISPDKKRFIQATITTLNMPWEALLLAIEDSDTNEVALLSLEPNFKKQQIILQGEAKNLASVLSYINRLEDHPPLEKAYLQKHSVDETNPFKPVKFTVLAEWRLAGKEQLNEQ
jgi:hypothetical protein